MRKTRSIGFILLALMLAIGIAACSGKKNEGASPSASKASPGDSSPKASSSDGAIDTSEFMKISYVILGDKPSNGQFEAVMEKVNKLMKEKINAELEWKWVEWADWQTKYNLLLASGDPVDLITIGTDWLDTWGNAQRGAFLNLDDLLPKYAPKTWESIPPENWAQSKYNGKIVLIPEDQYTQWVNHGFFYRGDWAKEAGITEPIKDWDGIEKYLQFIKDTKPDVIPWDVTGDHMVFNGWFNSYTDNLELPISTGWLAVFAGKSSDDPYTVVSPIFDGDTLLNFATKMKEWADKGFWREDVLNFKGDTRTELKGGLTGLDQHHTQTFGSLRVEMDREQPGSELQMFPYARTRSNLVELSITHGGTSLGAHSKHPERALMAYDLIRNDEEIYQLLNFGIEGVQYVIKDGKRVQPDGYEPKRDDFYSDFWGGRVDKFEIPSATVWDQLPTTLYAEYDKIKKVYPYGQFVFDKTPIDPELTAISQVAGELGPALSFGKAGDPAKAVEAFRSKLKAAGYDKVKAELQKQLDAFKAQMQQ